MNVAVRNTENIDVSSLQYIFDDVPEQGIKQGFIYTQQHPHVV